MMVRKYRRLKWVAAVLCGFSLLVFAALVPAKRSAERRPPPEALPHEIADPRCVTGEEVLPIYECHTKLIRECGGQLAWIRTKVSSAGALELIVYKVRSAGSKPVDVQCLFRDAKHTSDPQLVSSPVDYAWAENYYSKSEAVMRLDDGLLILSAPSSEGVSSVKHLSRDDYIVQAQYFTHSRNYGFNLSGDPIRSYPDGDVTYLDFDAGIYQVRWKKSYWSTAGAFWYSVVYDSDGILDLPPPDFEEEYACIPKDVFIACGPYAEEDLRRVKRDEICFSGSGGPARSCWDAATATAERSELEQKL